MFHNNLDHNIKMFKKYICQFYYNLLQFRPSHKKQ